MPADGIWNVDWLARNATRNFPFTDDATRTDTTGAFQVPHDLIVDLVFPVLATAYTAPENFHIMAVTSFGGGAIINIGYDGVLAGTASVSTGSFTSNSYYPVYGAGDFSESVGSIVIGTLDNLAALAAGTYTFTVAAGRLLPSVIRPSLRSVTSMSILQGADASDKLYGDVVLEAGQNTRLRVVSIAGVPTIYIDFIDGEGTIEECDCDNMPTDAPPIRTINGIPPNDAGNFTMLGSDCIQFSAITNGLWLSDICSEPCCGCDELAVVTDALNRLDTEVTTQGNYIERLDGSMTKLIETVIASKLSDIP